MGLHVQSLSKLPLNEDRDYYVYLLDYGWHEPLGEAMMKNFDKMAAIADENNAVVIRGTKRVHFEDEVLSWHHVNGEETEDILPAILITNRHPARFKESYNISMSEGVEQNLKMILIPLKTTCKNASDVVTLVEKLFLDIVKKKDLNEFRIQKELKKGIGSALADAIILEPNLKGEGLNYDDLVKYLSSENTDQPRKNKKMPKFFDTEIRETFDKQYLKVFLRDEADFDNIARLLNNLKSVKKANVTKQESGKIDFTIYPNRVFDIEEVNDEVKFAIENYYKGNPVDPNFITETISEVSDIAYYQIIDYVLMLGKNLESFRELNVRFDEERYRDYFLAFLNSISRNHSAKGEVFNRNGKTDILLFDNQGNNLFIAECKLWKGKKLLSDAIDQLLQNYVNWRDEKVALIVFNRDVAKFSDVIETAVNTTKEHSLCYKFIGQRKDTSFSFLFSYPHDVNKQLKFELILFNFS